MLNARTSERPNNRATLFLMYFLLWKIVDGVFNSTSEVKCKEFSCCSSHLFAISHNTVKPRILDGSCSRSSRIFICTTALQATKFFICTTALQATKPFELA